MACGLYVKKKLDPVAAGCPPSLHIIAAMALLVKDADKLALEQNVFMTNPRATKGVLKQPPDRWFNHGHMTHYQTLLVNPGQVTIQPPASLNPATLLPDPDLDLPLYHCSEILAQAHSIRPDLEGSPLPRAEWTWFTDGSSFIRKGQRRAGEQ